MSASFLIEGRHESYLEVWTAPPETLGAGAGVSESRRWKEGMVCVATATQSSHTMPIEVNERKGNREMRSDLRASGLRSSVATHSTGTSATTARVATSSRGASAEAAAAQDRVNERTDGVEDCVSE